MSASLGATTFTSVSWTSGDVITEAKLDNMTANDQAYDSHASQGILLDNDKSLGMSKSGSGNVNGLKLNSADELELGEVDTHVKNWSTFNVLVTATDQSTVTFNLQKGNIQSVTLGGNRTLALSNEKVGQAFVLRLIQDGSGSKTVTWFTTIKWVEGSEPTLSTGANKIDVFGFIVMSSGNYDGYIIGQNLS